ncbi:MAG TPA: exodeoxyribonuclease VII small subunit [Candidatus Coprocola pullicola]|nr:exodeoxyribonuclease VII small subunit [Candidatus Coprocola pullicola]
MAKKKLTFEQAVEKLEEIVETLETEEVSLEKSIALYKEGMALATFCKEKLTVAEGEVMLLQKDIEGKMEESPFLSEEMEE